MFSIDIQKCFVSHLFSVCFVFHQVHLPIAPFPNDPDENVIIHHSSKCFITRPETLSRYETFPTRITVSFRPIIQPHPRDWCIKISEEKFATICLVPATRFWKRRKSVALDSFSSLSNWQLTADDGERGSTEPKTPPRQRHSATQRLHVDPKAGLLQGSLK